MTTIQAVLDELDDETLHLVIAVQLEDAALVERQNNDGDLDSSQMSCASSRKSVAGREKRPGLQRPSPLLHLPNLHTLRASLAQISSHPTRRFMRRAATAIAQDVWDNSTAPP
jgi:hypothetical protein